MYHKFRDGHFSTVVVRCTVRLLVSRLPPSENPRITRLRITRYIIYTYDMRVQWRTAVSSCRCPASMCTRGICTARLYTLLLFLYTRVYLTRVGETRLVRHHVYTGRSTGSCLSRSCPSARNISKNLITAHYNV